MEKYPSGSTFIVNSTLKRISRLYGNRLRNGGQWRVRCLPYIYLVGVTKSGTSDLFENIIKHPNIVPGAIKEPMWWN